MLQGGEGNKKYVAKYELGNETIESSDIKAKLENGILDITLPKSAKKNFKVTVE